MAAAAGITNQAVNNNITIITDWLSLQRYTSHIHHSIIMIEEVTDLSSLKKNRRSRKVKNVDQKIFSIK
jgi:hypothetical protein